MFGFLSEGSGEIEDVFDSGWLGEVVVNGWSVREPIWYFDATMEAVDCVCWGIEQWNQQWG